MGCPQTPEFESAPRTLRWYRGGSVRPQNLMSMRPCNIFSQRKIALYILCWICEGRNHGTIFNKSVFFVDPMIKLKIKYHFLFWRLRRNIEHKDMFQGTIKNVKNMPSEEQLKEPDTFTQRRVDDGGNMKMDSKSSNIW